jgi:hypothetical protein
LFRQGHAEDQFVPPAGLFEPHLSPVDQLLQTNRPVPGHFGLETIPAIIFYN